MKSFISYGLKIINLGNALSGNILSKGRYLKGLTELGSIIERSGLKDLTWKIKIRSVFCLQLAKKPPILKIRITPKALYYEFCIKHLKVIFLENRLLQF